jgi:hypothetical protein
MFTQNGLEIQALSSAVKLLRETLVAQDKLIKIGELLVRAGLLNTSDVIESIQVSHRLQIPIGRVLIMAGTVTEHLLQAALQAQLLIKEELVTVDVACEALRLAVKEHKTLQQAFQELNVSPGYQQDLSAQIVELLLDSNIVTQEQLDEAMQTSSEADIPLSGALVLQGVLSAKFFPSILRAQELIRSGEASREEATEELKSSFLLWLKAEESLNLGDNAFLSDTDDYLVVEQPFEPLPFDGEAAFADGEFDQPQSELPKPRLIDMLKRAGVFNQHQVQKAYEEMLQDPMLSGRVFLAMGLTDEPTLNFAMRCHSLMKKGLLTEDQAMRAMRSSRSGMTSYEEALMEHAAESRPYFDPKWRKKTLRAFGGGVLGALVAGIAFSKAFKGR